MQCTELNIECLLLLLINKNNKTNKQFKKIMAYLKKSQYERRTENAAIRMEQISLSEEQQLKVLKVGRNALQYGFSYQKLRKSWQTLLKLA